jgi:hypothetical protein
MIDEVDVKIEAIYERIMQLIELVHEVIVYLSQIQ